MRDVTIKSSKDLPSSISGVRKSPEKAKAINAEDKAVKSLLPMEPEVNPSKPRRIFTAKYKLAILDELDRCTLPGEKGSILRREGLYTSSITEWRHQRNTGALTALNQVRGRKSRRDSKDEQIAVLEKEVGVLKQQLAQAEAVIDIQKKVSEIFGIKRPDNPGNGSKS